jgi:hypothetical protein
MGAQQWSVNDEAVVEVTAFVVTFATRDQGMPMTFSGVLEQTKSRNPDRRSVRLAHHACHRPPRPVRR